MRRLPFLFVVIMAIALNACKNDTKSPLEIQVKTSQGEFTILLPRNLSKDVPLEITIPALSWEWTGNLYYRYYQSDSEWSSMLFWVDEKEQMVSQPQLSQSPEEGTSIEYFIKLSNASTGELIRIPNEGAVVVEFF